MSDIGICEYCKYKDKDMIQNPCIGCSAQMGAFEFDMSAHDKQIRAEVVDEVKGFAQHYLIGMMDLENATKYGNRNAKQQDLSYGTLMRYEIANCVDDFLDSVEELKEQK